MEARSPAQRTPSRIADEHYGDRVPPHRSLELDRLYVSLPQAIIRVAAANGIDVRDPLAACRTWPMAHEETLDAEGNECDLLWLSPLDAYTRACQQSDAGLNALSWLMDRLCEGKLVSAIVDHDRLTHPIPPEVWTHRRGEHERDRGLEGNVLLRPGLELGSWHGDAAGQPIWLYHDEVTRAIGERRPIVIERSGLDVLLGDPAFEGEDTSDRSALTGVVRMAVQAGRTTAAPVRDWIDEHVEGWTRDGTGLVDPEGKPHTIEAIRKAITRV